MAEACRICYCKEFEDGMGEFLRPTPCKCQGARAQVHAVCLQRWQAMARSKAQWASGTRCHACGSEYTVSFERIPVGILGGTGLVGRALAARLASHPFFSIGPVAGSRASVGKSLTSVWREKEAALEAHYGASTWPATECPERALEGVVVASVDELLGCELVVSAIAPALGDIEDSLRDAGVAVFSISPHARDDPSNPLVVPEANAFDALAADAVVADLAARDSLPLFKSPNCVVCGLSIVLAALDAAFGLASLSATTFQALSGRGDAKYAPPDLVLANVYPLADTVEKTDAYQRAELRRLFPRLDKCAVAAHRVPVKNGHFVHVGCLLRRKPRDLHAVTSVLADFNPLRDKGLPSAPPAPIVLVDDLARPRPAHDHRLHAGMAVAVGQLRLAQTDADLFDLSFSLVLDNLVRGAYGAALLNAEIFQLYVKPRLPARRGHLPAVPVDASVSPPAPPPTPTSPAAPSPSHVIKRP